MIQTFIKLLKSCGPVVMYLEFLEGLASCKGTPFVCNQEHLLDALYLAEPTDRTKMPLDKPARGFSDIAIEKVEVIKTNKNRLHMTVETSTSQCREDETKAEIMICWQGCDAWEDGENTSALFHSAQSDKMGNMRTHIDLQCPEELGEYMGAVGQELKTKSLEWISLFDLTEAVTVEKEMGERTRSLSRMQALRPSALNVKSAKLSPDVIKNRTRIANYYQAQLDLYAEICLGRSRNCGRAIGKQFTYKLLMVGMEQAAIPDVFRASYVPPPPPHLLCRTANHPPPTPPLTTVHCRYARLVRNLYINVFPHEPVRMPQLVRPSSDVARIIKVECEEEKKEVDDSKLLSSVTTSILGSSADNGVAAGDDERPHPRRHKLLQVLDGERVLYTILGLVFVGIASLICESTFEKYDNSPASAFLEKLVLALFIIETVLRATAMGLTQAHAKEYGYDAENEHKGYLNDGMCLMDFGIIVLDLIGIVISEMADEGGTSSSRLQHAKALRVLRFARLLRLRRVLLQKSKQIKAAKSRKRKELTYNVSGTMPALARPPRNLIMLYNACSFITRARARKEQAWMMVQVMQRLRKSRN
jgi:hypothetical protein